MVEVFSLLELDSFYNFYFLILESIGKNLIFFRASSSA
jgi:hypothetical protein